MKKLFLTTSILALLGTAAYAGGPVPDCDADDESGNTGSAKVKPSLEQRIAANKEIKELEPKVKARFNVLMGTKLDDEAEFQIACETQVAKLAFLRKTMDDLTNAEGEGASGVKATDEPQEEVTYKDITLVGKKATYDQLKAAAKKRPGWSVEKMSRGKSTINVYDRNQNVAEKYKVHGSQKLKAFGEMRLERIS